MGWASRSAACCVLLAASLSGCCLEVISGNESESSTDGSAVSTGGASSGGSGGSSGSTSGSSDVGPATGKLWIDGVGAIDTNGVPSSGSVPFDETCFYPPSEPSPLYGGASAVDGVGDLWTQNIAGLFMWTPEQMAQSCASNTPMVALSLPPFIAIAFDSEGNLWGSVSEDASQIVGYRAADLKTSGAPAPTWTLTGDCRPSLDSLCHPAGLAFDADGNLWVGDGAGLQAFSLSTRAGPNDGGFNGTGPLADFHITTPYAAFLYDAGAAGTSGPFTGLAFDSAGALWIAPYVYPYPDSYFHLIAYSRTQLQSAKKNDEPGPARDIYFIPASTTLAPAGALAFDADGNLWVGGSLIFGDSGEPLFRLPAQSLALDAGPLPDLAAPDISISISGYGDTNIDGSGNSAGFHSGNSAASQGKDEA